MKQAEYHTLDRLRLVLALGADEPRDGARAIDGWDAAAWEGVQRAVEAWDAAPIAHASVRAAGLGKQVPAALLAAWRKDHTQTTAVNLRLAFEAETLCAALAEEGARAAPLKGTALFMLGVWRDPGARPTCDVDLVIAPGAGMAVDRVLRARGYERTRVGGSKHWPPFVRDGLVVEVHEHAFWSLSDGHRVPLGEMVDAKGRPALGPAVAHLLHHLFESSVTTPWLIVKTLADLAETRAFAIARAGTEPAIAGECAEAARRFGLGRRLGALAGLLEQVLEVPVFPAWTRETRAADVEVLLRRCEPVARPFEAALRLPDRARAFARMPLAEKTALLRHHLLPPPEAMRALYGLSVGSPWVWPLYPLRPLHLLARSAADATRLVLGKDSPRSRRV